jgi:hypothetical protein
MGIEARRRGIVWTVVCPGRDRAIFIPTEARIPASRLTGCRGDGKL